MPEDLKQGDLLLVEVVVAVPKSPCRTFTHEASDSGREQPFASRSRSWRDGDFAPVNPVLSTEAVRFRFGAACACVSAWITGHRPTYREYIPVHRFRPQLWRLEGRPDTSAFKEIRGN